METIQVEILAAEKQENKFTHGHNIFDSLQLFHPLGHEQLLKCVEQLLARLGRPASLCGPAGKQKHLTQPPSPPTNHFISSSLKKFQQ